MTQMQTMMQKRIVMIAAVVLVDGPGIKAVLEQSRIDYSLYGLLNLFQIMPSKSDLRLTSVYTKCSGQLPDRTAEE
jgi:hypothetical protein